MAEEIEPQKKRSQSSHAAEEIRVDALAKLAQAGDDAYLGPRPDPRGRRTASLPKGIVWGVAGLIILFVGGFAVSYYAIRRGVVSSIASRAVAMQAGVQDLQNFDLQSASKEFSSLNSAQFSTPSGFIGILGSLFSGSSDAFGAFGDLSSQLGTLTDGLTKVQNDLWGAVAGAEGANTTGTPLVADLKGVRTALGAIDADTDRISGFASVMGGMGGSDGYLALKTQVQSAEKFLDAFIPWLSDASTTHHVLVLLENPSEMRPGGGFLGSYADVAVRNGAVENISIHDVADADAAFTQKIVPPKPLQLEQTGWRPADGNWFFDFPTSASATISLFEKSSLYENPSVTFDGAIAVTPQAMGDVLSVTGPVTIANSAIGVLPANGSTTFSSDSLTVQIQKIVQAGQAGQGASTYPKKVLGALWSSVLGSLASSTDEQRQQMLGLAAGWIADKDVMVYFKDPDLESFMTMYGAAGDEFVPPQNFNGDYLAVVNTDVNSDKAELYVSSTVDLNVAIGSDGVATDHLVVTRVHHGNQSPYWWYQTTSQDYMQMIVPAGSSLVNESGGFVKSIPAPVSYAAKGYATDPLLAALEAGTKQSFIYPAVSVRTTGAGGDIGKGVFSVWSRTYKNSSSSVTFDYSHQLFSTPADGVQYQFVFERQSGAEGHYKFEVDAPLGYTFAENGLASYVYDEDSMPGRLTILLTLQKI
ncbi:MAG: DUF4012 domain-containing protein [Candidatus Pacebacteria bacterium]|nr:DUF4012 domain-containing protein [Candidatus Paceibacterota bacterium]